MANRPWDSVRQTARNRARPAAQRSVHGVVQPSGCLRWPTGILNAEGNAPPAPRPRRAPPIPPGNSLIALRGGAPQSSYVPPTSACRQRSSRQKLHSGGAPFE